MFAAIGHQQISLYSWAAQFLVFKSWSQFIFLNPNCLQYRPTCYLCWKLFFFFFFIWHFHYFALVTSLHKLSSSSLPYVSSLNATISQSFSLTWIHFPPSVLCNFPTWQPCALSLHLKKGWLSENTTKLVCWSLAISIVMFSSNECAIQPIWVPSQKLLVLFALTLSVTREFIEQPEYFLLF